MRTRVAPRPAARASIKSLVVAVLSFRFERLPSEGQGVIANAFVKRLSSLEGSSASRFASFDSRRRRSRSLLGIPIGIASKDSIAARASSVSNRKRWSSTSSSSSSLDPLDPEVDADAEVISFRRPREEARK
jgi:hypothetical protein